MFRCSIRWRPGSRGVSSGGPRPVAALVLAALLGTAAPAVRALDGAALVEVGASIVKVEVRREQGGYALGSGVVVAADKVVTNCHVTRDGIGAHVLRGGLRYAASAQASDLRHDLCVLAVPGLGAPAVALAAADAQPLQPGRPLSAIGFTGGQQLQHSAGAVVALHRLDGAQVIQCSNWFSSGASGGGLFDDTGRLVGVLTFRLRGGAAHYFAAPAAWLPPLLRDEALQPVAPLRGGAAAFWELPADAQPRFLQAAVFERERRWPELDALAAAWAREDRADAQPWLARGLAQQQLGRLAGAQQALEQALRVEPTSQPALLRLGLVHVAQGHLERAQALLLRLQSLRSELAVELDRAIPRP